MAEHKQREHFHISDGGKAGHKSEVNTRIALRRMAEHKQREHSHISDGGKADHRSEVNTLIACSIEENGRT